MMTLFTIGYASKKEDEFYSLLDAASVRRLIDIRLWCVARFVPWASGTNLQKHLGEKYVCMPKLAPTKELLSGYKDGSVSWNGYEKIFNASIAERRIEKLFTDEYLDGMCLLCTEKLPTQCHRRLVAEYLAAHFPNMEIRHL